MMNVNEIESAIVVMDASADNLIIIIGNEIEIGGEKVKKILISEELIEDYGRVGPFGDFIIDINVPNRIKKVGLTKCKL